MIVKWLRGDYRASAHAHAEAGHERAAATCGAASGGAPPPSVRTPAQALAIGMLHGLAGTGAVVVLLIAALPSQLEAALALAVFAPMSMVSMALCTSASPGCSRAPRSSRSTERSSFPASACSA